jgi:hypothetical protein
MKKIDVSSILPGSLAEGDLYTEKGKFLILKMKKAFLNADCQEGLCADNG